MTLITCSEHGSEISSEEAKCPKCGHSMKQQVVSVNKPTMLSIAIFIISGSAFLIACFKFDLKMIVFEYDTAIIGVVLFHVGLIMCIVRAR